MLIIVSPAKKLDFETTAPTTEFTRPLYPKLSLELITCLNKMSARDIKSLMKLSDNLIDLNMNRYKDYSTPFTLKNSKQALFAFKGDTYVGLDAETMKKDEIDYAQKHLRILSGLYGILSPLDLMQPYRLEMGTKLKISHHKNLYEFWGDRLTDNLNKDLKKENILVNLASKEYFSAIDFKKIQGEVITPVFKEKKGDDYKVVGLFSKRARGMMSRFIIDNKVKTAKGLQEFQKDGYKFSKKLSIDSELVFLRSR